MNYVVVEKVLRKMGMPEADVAAAVAKFKARPAFTSSSYTLLLITAAQT